MDAIVGDWLNLILRWTHVITGIAWIGASFFFMWLDSHLTPPERPREGVSGELWMTHSGGFYIVEKMRLTPAEMPRTLHWFKWEAAFTWMSGFLLLVLIYYLGAGVYLIDPATAPVGPRGAVALGVGVIALAWVVYDALWRSPVGRNAPLFAAGVAFLLLVGVAYGFSRVFTGHGAYIHVGALMGTLMAANVWMRIIPAQKELVAATREGREPDAALAAAAKQRSVHNNYMTLPVVFVMLSGHYPGTFGHPYNWLILAVLFLIGATVRHWFNLRNRGERSLWPWPTAAVALLALAYAAARTAPGGPEAGASAGAGAERVAFAQVRAVIATRCAVCHAARPTHEAFDAPPAGVVLETPEQIKRRAPRILARTVVTRTMPLGNATHMTEEERDLLGRWIRQGARID